MADHNKYGAPSGPPPNYPMSPPPAQHYDAGPYNQGQWQQQGQWGPPQPGYDQYGQNYGPPNQGYYGPPQGGMTYQQGMPPQQGYYVQEQRRGPGAGEGCCAALLDEWKDVKEHLATCGLEVMAMIYVASGVASLEGETTSISSLRHQKPHRRS
ncbi:hypothetical protein LTR70_000565 [Exophiala xenobiotica]|uniref:Uncharacterized protein n=1 Tax=Lithohypha guttulata TaxID=1690604 RepID=A0ABR0KKH1_9EURO|nr:hypothetical protein LTR24_002187 [Lithohypha guttulata]KAK5329416.1 hypothetical protein LTR70_000565 [Exophiala xenobiotica]